MVSRVMLLVLLVGGLLAAVFLSRNPQIFQNLAGEGASVLTILPSEAALKPDAILNVFVQPGERKIVFVRATVAFNQSEVSLVAVSEIASELGNVVKVSSLAEANANGRLELVAAVKPSQEPIRESLRMASLTFTVKDDEVGRVRSHLRIDPADSQVVGENGEQVDLGDSSALTARLDSDKASVEKEVTETDLGLKLTRSGTRAERKLAASWTEQPGRGDKFNAYRLALRKVETDELMAPPVPQVPETSYEFSLLGYTDGRYVVVLRVYYADNTVKIQRKYFNLQNGQVTLE